MRYGKLNGEIVEFAPNPIRLKGCRICNPTEAQLKKAGYSPVAFTDPPAFKPGYMPVAHWEEQNGQITQLWEIVPEPSDSQPSYEQLQQENQAMEKTLKEMGVVTR